MEIIKKYTILRRLMMLFAVVTIGMSMTSCSDDDDDKQQGAVPDLTTGVWIADEGDELFYELVFDKDGFEMEVYDMDETIIFSGAYSQSGNNVELVIKYCSVPGESVPRLSGTVDGDRLIFAQGGERLVFYRESYDPDDDYDDEDW